jgi:hypothetical protein
MVTGIVPSGHVQVSSTHAGIGTPMRNSREETAMMTLWQRPAGALALALVLLAARHAAADEATPAIGGFVTLDGKPFEAGKIIFYLDDDQFVGARIKTGVYKVSRVPAGTWRVAIEAEGIPAKYSSEEATPLRVEVKAGTNHFDLDLRK